jgi:hypothetical protein
MPKSFPKFVQIAGTDAAVFALDETGAVWAYGVTADGKQEGWAEMPNHRFPQLDPSDPKRN